MLAQLHEQFPQDVRIVYRHFPLPMHDKSLLAAQAAEAAGLQGQFWEMTELIFREQPNWAAQTPAEFADWLNTQAEGLGLDPSQFKTDLESEPVVQKAKKAQAEAEAAGITATPTLFLDGLPYAGGLGQQDYNAPLDFQSLAAIVRLKLLEPRQFTGCPPMVIDPHKQYLATLKTDQGDIVIQLFADKAPLAVNSFVYLAQKGWFDGVTFHRVLPGFIAQTGDPSGTGYGSPGYAFGDELDPGLKFDQPGVVGMANAGPGSNGSQFFFTYSPQPSLNGKHTIFGQIIQGMDVAQNLTPRNPTGGGEPPAGSQILSVTIEEK